MVVTLNASYVKSKQPKEIHTSAAAAAAGGKRKEKWRRISFVPPRSTSMHLKEQIPLMEYNKYSKADT